ncbi:ATP-binding cassette domain-containing protein [Candidatus Sumerlaeota bacterium]|nr:ATP-binding cassette domain-containing protein [Candidatus Sumerlaeota bacterium]
MAEPALRLQDISKRFGDFNAVDGLSFEVPAGSIYGFLGPNGAGKTTTIRMILEILKPTSGSITILGRPSALEVRHRIGYLPEEKGLYKKMKAWATISYFARLKGMDRKSAKKRAYELLERYGLADFAEARTEALSKGMGQKVQVLASIAHDPDFVILDEPFSGLDPVNQGVMEELIKDMAARGRTTLFSTHVMQHAERICDRILLIAKGRKIFDGTIEEAKRTVPRRVRIESDDDVSVLASMDEVAGIHAIDEEGGAVDSAEASNGHAFWELHMRDDADPQSILQACYERGIRLRRFDHTDPTLHEVFVNLVGDEAREVKRR